MRPLFVTHGELMALHEGLRILNENWFQNVLVTTDFVWAVQTITMPQEEMGYISTSADDLNELLMSTTVSSFFHVKRYANVVAHSEGLYLLPFAFLLDV